MVGDGEIRTACRPRPIRDPLVVTIAEAFAQAVQAWGEVWTQAAAVDRRWMVAWMKVVAQMVAAQALGQVARVAVQLVELSAVVEQLVAVLIVWAELFGQAVAGAERLAVVVAQAGKAAAATADKAAGQEDRQAAAAGSRSSAWAGRRVARDRAVAAADSRLADSIAVQEFARCFCPD